MDLVRDDEVLELFTRTEDGVFVVDSSHRIMLWNQAAQRILGFSAAEVIGKPCFSIVSGMDQAGHAVCQMDCRVMLVGKTRGIAPSVQLATKTKDGQPVWLNITHIVIPSRDAKLSSMVHIFRDISKQMESQDLIARLAQLATGSLRHAARPTPVQGSEPYQDQLTPREVEVLRQMCQGKNSKAIADDLIISRTTARNHIQSILSKLEVHTALEAVAFASSHRLISRD